MAQASKPLTGQNYLMGQPSVVRLSIIQWSALKAEGIVDVLDISEFDDDDIDNIVRNLRRPRDIYHLTVPVYAESAAVVVNPTSGVLFQAVVNQRA